MQSNQEEKAAQLKEREGDYQQAIELYLKGGLPAKAAHLVIQYSYTGNYELLERIAQALSKAGLYEKVKFSLIPRVCTNFDDRLGCSLKSLNHLIEHSRRTEKVTRIATQWNCVAQRFQAKWYSWRRNGESGS